MLCNLFTNYTSYATVEVHRERLPAINSDTICFYSVNLFHYNVYNNHNNTEWSLNDDNLGSNPTKLGFVDATSKTLSCNTELKKIKIPTHVNICHKNSLKYVLVDARAGGQGKVLGGHYLERNSSVHF